MGVNQWMFPVSSQDIDDCVKPSEGRSYFLPMDPDGRFKITPEQPVVTTEVLAAKARHVLKEVRKKGSARAYAAFIKTYPNSDCAGEAKLEYDRIIGNIFRPELASVIDIGAVRNLREYVAVSPSGCHVSPANDVLMYSHDEALLTEDSLQHYLAHNPSGMYVMKARDLLRRLKDDELTDERALRSLRDTLDTLALLAEATRPTEHATSSKLSQGAAISTWSVERTSAPIHTDGIDGTIIRTIFAASTPGKWTSSSKSGFEGTVKIKEPLMSFRGEVSFGNNTLIAAGSQLEINETKYRYYQDGKWHRPLPTVVAQPSVVVRYLEQDLTNDTLIGGDSDSEERSSMVAPRKREPSEGKITTN